MSSQAIYAQRSDAYFRRSSIGPIGPVAVRAFSSVVRAAK